MLVADRAATTTYSRRPRAGYAISPSSGSKPLLPLVAPS